MFSDVWNSILGFFGSILEFFYNIFHPIFGDNSWGWAIIALTLLVRIIILPLAVKQFRSMRAMQALQPQLKELQKKYKVDRELMRKDPEQYRAKRQKLNEEMMALYQREGASPAASCLPLLAQAPVFIALFWTIRNQAELDGAPFYFFTNFISADSDAQGLAALVSQSGWPGWMLIVLMSGTMFLTQKQMMARNAATQAAGGDGPNMMAQQQKILLYVMPLFLAFISFQFPLGLLLYWCTTNLWQVAQQSIILRGVKQEAESGELADKPGGESLKRFKRRKQAEDAADPQIPGRKRSPGASSGSKELPEGDGGHVDRATKAGDSGSKHGSDAKGAPGTPGVGGAGRNDKPGGKAKGNASPNRTSKSSSKGGSGSPTQAGKRGHLPRGGGAGRSSSGGKRS